MRATSYTMDESFPLMGRKPEGDWSRKVKFGFIFACLGSLLTVAAFTTAGDGALARLGDSPFMLRPSRGAAPSPAVDNVRAMRAMAALAQAEASTSTSANTGALASQVQQLLEEVKQLTATNADLEQKLLDAESQTSKVRSKLLTSSAGGTSAHDDEAVTELQMQNDLLLERLQTSLTDKYALHKKINALNAEVESLDLRVADTNFALAGCVNNTALSMQHFDRVQAAHEQALKMQSDRVDMLEADLAASESGDTKAAIADYKSKLQECSDARAALLEEKEAHADEAYEAKKHESRALTELEKLGEECVAHGKRAEALDAEVAALISDLDKCDEDSSAHESCQNTLSELRKQPWCQPPADPEPEFVPNGCDETLYGYRGRGYRGCQTQTIGGYECQPWASQSPHAHAQTEDRFITETLEEAGNYCRNPDNGDTIWCYTTDPEKRWEYCQPAPVDYWCADENGECECVGGVVVYGREDTSFEDVITNGEYQLAKGGDLVGCNNDDMGGDPAPGNGKRCWCAPEGSVPGVAKSSATVIPESPEYVPSATPTPAPTPAPVPTPTHEDAKEMSDLETCRQACAAQNECCNNDITQGSNQKLSCLQACMVVKSGVSKDECLEHCPVAACSREINGMEFDSCSVCDDVPAHKEAFGDDFRPASYECSAKFGTNEQSCEAGCNAGAEGDYDYSYAEAPEPEPEPEPTPAPTPEPEDVSEMSDFEMCQNACAAQNECCNNDISQGSNQKLSCLQACMVVRGGATKAECMEQCPVDSCSREINGVTYESCQVCDDVPAHEGAFGDDFKPAPYECSATYGTNQASCEKGCAAGAWGAAQEAEDFSEFVDDLDDSAMAPEASDESVEELVSQVDLPPEQQENLEETYEQLFASNFAECQSACAAQNECCNNDISQGSSQKLSCLQACMVVKSGASESECMEQCPVAACSREINGVTYESCQVCDDVPAHKEAFGDDFKPAPYQCSETYGTSQASCEKGCAAGAASYDDYVETPSETPQAAPAPDYVCADENGQCACEEGVAVYGNQDFQLADVLASGSYVAKWNPGFVGCDNDSMGGDPAPGNGKRCWCAPEGMVPEQSQPEATATPEPTPEPESESELGDFETCQFLCAAQNECCNNDISQGSNQKLSCLQACMVVKSGVSKDECQGNCGTSECSRDINGVTYNSCQVCDDVPAHKDAFGDLFVGAPYECSATYGTNEDSCMAGCEAGEKTLGPKTTEQVLEDAPSAEEAAEEEEHDEVADTHMATCDWYCTSELAGEIDDEWYQHCFTDCMEVFDMCIDKCAAHNECCNNDFMQGSNQKLSCLQACIARFDTWTEDECLESCPTNTCTREFHGITFDSCSTCDDVPAHEQYFGDKYKPQSYQCSATYGTSEESCERGCKAGSEIIETDGKHDYMHHGELEESARAAAKLGEASGGRKSLAPRRASVSVKRERAAMKQGKRGLRVKAARRE